MFAGEMAERWPHEPRRSPPLGKKDRSKETLKQKYLRLEKKRYKRNLRRSMKHRLWSEERVKEYLADMAFGAQRSANKYEAQGSLPDAINDVEEILENRQRVAAPPDSGSESE